MASMGSGWMIMYLRRHWQPWEEAPQRKGLAMQYG